jgi:hypothetical protein
VIRTGNWSQPARRKLPANALAALLSVGVLLASCAIPPGVKDAVDKARAEKPKVATFHRLEFSGLAGWDADDHAPALNSFKASCETIMARAPDKAMGGHEIYGTSAQWRSACSAAAKTNGAQRW